MRGSIALLLGFCALVAAAQAEDRLIPRSPLTTTELDRRIKILKLQGYNEGMLQVALKDPKQTTTYRDADIRRIFPEVHAQDEQAWLCTNRIMSGATDIAYFSQLPQPHRVRVTRIQCQEHKTRLLCRSVESKEETYLDRPRRFFELDPNIPLEEVRSLFSLLDTYGIDGVDEWYRGLRSRDLRAVTREGDGIRLDFGQAATCSCISRITVRAVTPDAARPDQRLKMVGKEPVGYCF